MKEKTKLVNFDVSVTLLKAFDEVIAGRYGSRAEALREFMRNMTKKEATKQ